MDIYVASSARRSVTHTQSLLERVKENSDIRAFFPAHLGDYTGSEERMRYIENICDKHIKKADIMIAVYPFGLSVSNEIGRFIVYRKSSLGTKRKLIIWDTSIPGSEEYMLLRTEAMIMPHVDHMVSDIASFSRPLIGQNPVVATLPPPSCFAYGVALVLCACR